MGGISQAGRTELSRVVEPGRVLVTVNDAVERLGVSRSAAAKKLSWWTKQGWLRRVRRGLYIRVPVEFNAAGRWTADPLYLATVVWSPCYITGWTSAHHWELTEQVFRTTIVKSAQRVRTNKARLLEHDYLVLHIDRDQIWGTKDVWDHGTRVLVADPARTVIDMLDAPKLGGGIRHVSDVLTTYLEEHSAERLVEYGDRLGNRAVFKRLGFLVESLDPSNDALLVACRDRISRGLSLLDPAAEPSGRHVRRWALRINAHVPEPGAS